MVEGHYVVAQGFAEFEGALELGLRRLGGPDDVEVVEHGEGRKWFWELRACEGVKTVCYIISLASGVFDSACL